MYYTKLMTETAERTGTTVRTIRMRDDAWDMIGLKVKAARSDHSAFVRDMADAGVDCARCYRCFELVPVEFGDLTGKPLAEWVAEAGKTVTAQHRAGHHPVTIGNAAPKAAPGSAVFLEPGGKPAVTAVPARAQNTAGRRS